MKDSQQIRYDGLRKRLLGILRQKNIRNYAVLDAIGKIPRHLFVAQGLENVAYEDRALSIASEQTISQPYTVALQTTLLEINAKDKVLEIGTGSGYQAAVLSAMGAIVFTIERQKELYEQLLNAAHFKRYANVHLHFGDGYLGLVNEQPFDKVLITACCSEVPKQLFEQLKIGGYMVFPQGEKDATQTMVRIIKRGFDRFDTETHGQFQFVPMLRGTN